MQDRRGIGIDTKPKLRDCKLDLRDNDVLLVGCGGSVHAIITEMFSIRLVPPLCGLVRGTQRTRSPSGLGELHQWHRFVERRCRTGSCASCEEEQWERGNRT